ncbi:hypothetical protein, partial [Methanoregula sp.]|uniref:hypothetical protein n=1 Tax=Methanoregula sp. TaxID=2052170 RepID=UPI003BB04BE3
MPELRPKYGRWVAGSFFLDSDILFHDDRSPKHQRITWDYHRAQESGMPDMNVKKCVSYFENSPYLYLNMGLR